MEALVERLGAHGVTDAVVDIGHRIGFRGGGTFHLIHRPGVFGGRSPSGGLWLYSGGLGCGAVHTAGTCAARKFLNYI